MKVPNFFLTLTHSYTITMDTLSLRQFINLFSTPLFDGVVKTLHLLRHCKFYFLRIYHNYAINRQRASSQQHGDT